MTGHTSDNLNKADLQTSIAAGEIHIWRIGLDRPTQGLLGLLSPDETKRAERFKQTSDRNHFIRAHEAVRVILGGYLGISGEKLRFGVGEKGKPYLIGPDTTIEFNLSHCENMALLAVTQNIPVGIDLERLRVRPSQLKIAKRLFSDSIYTELSALPPDQLDAAFLQHWTELEARAKCVGNGIFSSEYECNHMLTSHFNPGDGWIACMAIMQQDDTGTLNLQHINFRN